MNGRNALADMETLFMALADKTRLRLLNLMRDGEVCVCFFTEVLGQSQPKISRHLAYLRNAGIVAARRDGKWMHYSIRWPESEGAGRVLDELFDWMDSREELQGDKFKYAELCTSPETLLQIARTPIRLISPKPDMRTEPVSTYNPSHNELDEFLL